MGDNLKPKDHKNRLPDRGVLFKNIENRHVKKFKNKQTKTLGTIFILRKDVLRLFRTTHPLRKGIFITSSKGN